MNFYFIGTWVLLIFILIMGVIMIKQNIKPKTEHDKKSIKYQKLKPLNHRKQYSKFSKEYYRDLWNYKFKKKRLFLIFMKLRNGNWDSSVIATRGRYFEKLGGTYFIDQDIGVRDLGTGFNTLFYHQDCAIPFSIDFNIDNLNDKIKNADESVLKAINPSSFRGFIDSEVIEKVLKGQELSDQLKRIYMIVIIGLVVNVIAIIMIAKASGWI